MLQIYSRYLHSIKIILINEKPLKVFKLSFELSFSKLLTNKFSFFDLSWNERLLSLLEWKKHILPIPLICLKWFQCQIDHLELIRTGWKERNWVFLKYCLFIMKIILKSLFQEKTSQRTIIILFLTFFVRFLKKKDDFILK